MDHLQRALGRLAGKMTIVSRVALGLAAFAFALAACEDNKVESAYQQGAAAYVAYDDTNAVRLFTLAANGGDGAARTILGMMFLSGEGVPQDREEGYRWLKLAAEQGDAEAQAVYALSLLIGEVPRDDEAVRRLAESMRWLGLAAKQSNAKALASLGEMYFNLKKSNTDFGVSDVTTLFGEELPNVEAQTLLTVLAEVLPKTEAEAILMIRRAADQGEAGAQRTLAAMYRGGRGVPESDAEAVRWYGLAANQGDPDAQFDMGELYSFGLLGVAENNAEAVRLFKLAAEQGHLSAQAVLASRYDEGDGVPENFIEAYKWYNLAAASSDWDYYKNEKAKLRSKMTPDQIAEAQRLSSVWKPRTRKLAPFLREAVPPSALSR